MLLILEKGMPFGEEGELGGSRTKKKVMLYSLAERSVVFLKQLHFLVKFPLCPSSMP
jgi:hypothetical protein